MFIPWGWLLFAIFAVVITCFGLYLAGEITAFNSPRIVQLNSDLEYYKGRLSDRDRELTAAIIERDKIKTECDELAAQNENMKRNFRDMEAERAHLRQMILDAKNVLMES